MRRPAIRSRHQMTSSVRVYFNNTQLTTDENAEQTRTII